MKKLTALVLALCLVFSLCACGADPSEGTGGDTTVNPSEAGGTAGDATEGGRTLPGGLFVPEGKTTTIVLQCEMDPGTLNPWGSQNSGITAIRYSINEALFRYSESGTIVPQLVETYEWIDDTTMRIKLWDGIHDSEGNPFTTSDVLFCLTMAKDSAPYSAKTTSFDYDKISIIDELTMDIAFTSANYLVYDNLASIFMVTEAAYNASGDEMYANFVGLGTYKVESWIPGSQVVLAKNDNYWVTDELAAKGAYRYNQNVDRAIFKIVEDSTQRTIELESGSVDVVYYLPTTAVDLYQGDSNYQVWSDSTTIQKMIYFNCTNTSAFENQDLRKAVAYAVNNDEINVGAYDGVLIPATQLANPTTQEYVEGKVDYPFDLTKAQEYMDAAGYSDGLTIHCIYPTGFELAAQIVQDQLSKINITMTIEEVDASNITSIINGSPDGWDICINQNAMNCGTVLFYFYNLLNGNGTTRGGWKDDSYQAVFEEALKTGDLDLCNQALAIVTEACPSYAVAYQAAWHVGRIGIQNPIVSANGPMFGSWEFTPEATWLIDD